MANIRNSTLEIRNKANSVGFKLQILQPQSVHLEHSNFEHSILFRISDLEF